MAVIRGAFGFGSIAPAVLFGSMVTEPHHAVLLALATNFYGQVQILPAGLRDGDWKVARPLFIAGFVAIFAGLLLFKSLERGWLSIVIGLAMASLAALDYFRLLDRLAERVDLRNMGIAVSLSTVSGLLAGIGGGGGMYFYSIYLKLVCPTPTLMRGTSILVGSVFLYWRFASALVLGLISPRLMVEALILLPPALIGAWVGIRFFQQTRKETFYAVFQLVLVSGAVILLIKGLQQVL